MTLRAVPLIVATLLISACAGTPFDWSSARQIKTGMTEQQVTAIMGPPFLVKSQHGGVTWVWSYADAFSGAKTVSAVFQDGKVTDPPPIPESFK